MTSSKPQSAFYVRLGQYNPSSERTLHFRQVIDNEQKHYSTKTGLFTCVIPGVYRFRFLCASSGGAGSVQLQRNKKPVHQGGRYVSSGKIVLHLREHRPEHQMLLRRTSAVRCVIQTPPDSPTTLLYASGLFALWSICNDLQIPLTSNVICLIDDFLFFFPFWASEPDWRRP